MKSAMVVIMCFVFLWAFQTNAHAGLIAYYSFDKGTANDDSGNGFNGNVVDAVSTNDGYFGKAYDFNMDLSGKNEYIQIPNLDINTGNYPTLTMGAWVKSHDATPVQQVISDDNGGYDRSLGIDNRTGTDWPTDPPQVPAWSTFTGENNGVLRGSNVTNRQWTFVAVSYDEIAKTAMLYVNGTTFTSPTSFGSGYSDTYIGHNPGFGEYFQGTIDEVFFFDKALTKTQLDNIMANGVKAVPEPISSTLFLLGAGALGLRPYRRKKVRS